MSRPQTSKNCFLSGSRLKDHGSLLLILLLLLLKIVFDSPTSVAQMVATNDIIGVDGVRTPNSTFLHI
jgi:hypothetical protein